TAMSQTLLSPLEQRVLGCLLEKQLSTPDGYPLSLNALLHACNQASNREPVMEVSEADLAAPVERLVDLGLAERWPGRVMKVAHLAQPRWNLSVQEAALLAELLLRGPQTPGELRANTRRMYTFPDMTELEACLALLLEAEPPLVERLPRAPGARESRLRHALGEAGPEPAIAPAPPREPGRLEALEAEVAALRVELAALKDAFEAFRAQF
ncbi:MAG TPA: DUF480 domain-containing protein, partial [Holophagaceae bacterium]